MIQNESFYSLDAIKVKRKVEAHDFRHIHTSREAVLAQNTISGAVSVYETGQAESL